MILNQRKILIVTFLVEGFLLGAFFVWAELRGYPFPMALRGWDIMAGTAASLPILVLNFLLFGSWGERYRWLESCYRFREQIVRPLVNALDIRAGLIVSLCAGLGEEFFFRGIIQEEFGIVVASFLFSFLHFGLNVYGYLFVSLLYAGIGFYFGWLVAFTGSIWIAVVAHGVYDFIALLYLRYFMPKSTTGLRPSR